MKIGVFTDSHYSSQALTCGNRYNNKSLIKIRQAYDFFEKEKCDLVVCLGDLIDKEDSHEKEMENLKNVAKVIKGSTLQTICIMGNHDAFAFAQEEFYKILGLNKPESMEMNGKTFLFIDACYYKNGKPYMPGYSDWTNTFYPHTEALKDKLANAMGDVYIFIHQNLDPAIRQDHCVHNADNINEILSLSGKVKAVYQGHYHPGNKSVHNGIKYITFPAMCENELAYYIEEL